MLKKLLYGLLKKLRFLPAPFYMKIFYEYYHGKKLDLKNPLDFNQKIQWLKVYYRPPILSQLVDKYEVRKYVSDKVGDKYLNDLIAVYTRVGEIDFDALPEQYVIKAVHGYHFNLIVKDKTKLNKIKAKFLLRKWMSKNQYWRGGREWAYKNVKPKLIAEKYLVEMGRDDVSDYKFFCFDGEPKFLHIDVDRGSNHSRAYYDIAWKKLPIKHDIIDFIEGEVEKPEKFDEMVNVASKLAGKFPFVRVDLYNLKGKIIFGEMTFYPADGRLEFQPEEYNTSIGDLIKLPEIPKGQKYITSISQ